MDFNKFVKKTKEATMNVGKKANDLVEITKLNLEIVDLENEIEDLYQEIGIFVFNSYKNNIEIPEIIKEKCKVIEEKSEKVAELKQKVSEYKSTLICPVCKTENDKENQFCSKCGQKF